MNAALLALETATNVCGVAVLHEGRLTSRSVQGGRQHDARLLELATEVLEEAGLRKSQLNAVGVSAGPGSYTGLRIGVSAAKAIATALDIPLVAVPTLAGVAHASTRLPAAEAGSVVLACLPSRKKEVFCRPYRLAEVPSPLGSVMAGDVDVVLNELRGSGIEPVHAVGPGADRAEGLLPFTLQPCSPESVALVADQMRSRKVFEDAELFEPYYFKDFQAGTPTKSVFARLPF